METLILTWLRLLQKQAVRPVGLNVDNIAKEFKTVVACLDAGLPGSVLYDKATLKRAQRHVDKGGIVVDMAARRVLGFELGQDALHVYKRLLKTINTQSVDAAWAIRCLRKWLGSLNPEVRFGRGDAEPIFGGADHRHAARTKVMDEQVADVRGVLDLYFRGAALPTEAFNILKSSVKDRWCHPEHEVQIPLPAKVAILEDAAIVLDASADRRQKAAADAFRLAYTPAGHPSPASIADDLCGLANLFAKTNFEKARGGASPEWYQAQVRYLRHARIRAAGPARRMSKPRDLPVGATLDLSEPAGHVAELGDATNEDSTMELSDSESSTSSTSGTSISSVSEDSEDEDSEDEEEQEGEASQIVQAVSSEAKARCAAGSKLDRVVLNQ
eukprot:5761613-Karenia_brevis.AAC.1